MGAADDEGAAVDPQLRLRGLRNLRVADASIFPLQLGVNPNLTIAMLAERCAAWVLGLELALQTMNCRLRTNHLNNRRQVTTRWST